MGMYFWASLLDYKRLQPELQCFGDYKCLTPTEAKVTSLQR